MKQFTVGVPSNPKIVEAPDPKTAVAFYEREEFGEVHLIVPVFRVNERHWQGIPFWLTNLIIGGASTEEVQAALAKVDQCKFVVLTPQSLADMKDFPQTLEHGDALNAYLLANPEFVVDLTNAHKKHNDHHAQFFTADCHENTFVTVARFGDPEYAPRIYFAEAIQDATLGEEAHRVLGVFLYADLLEYPAIHQQIMEYERELGIYKPIATDD